MQKLFFIFFAFIFTYSSLYSQQEPLNKNTELNILFIGNSLTYTNNLPLLVQENARLKGIDINTKMLAFPNYAIEDHWNEGQVKELTSSKKYDFVILQQGPSSQADGRRMLIDYGRKYARLCKKKEATLCYFMVWPSLNQYYTFNDVIKNHTDAASINKSVLLPVGKAWKAYIDSTKNNDYYSTDGFHPSMKGSQLAAEVILEHLLQQ